MNKFNFMWVLSLFGTAVGAGILFLPINAGIAGFWPLIIMTIIIGPMTYLSHRGLSFFVLSSKQKNSDITFVVREHFGEGFGKIIIVLYFFAIFPILLIYGNGITNTFDSFIINQLHFDSPNRAILSLILIVSLVSVMLLKERAIFRVTNIMTYPLILVLFFISLYLIPHWNLSALKQAPSVKDFFIAIWISIPVLVFSFNHSPAISSFALSLKNNYKDFEQAEQNIESTSRVTATLLVFFIMFFVFSCVLALSPVELAQARAQNISILSFLANKLNAPFISYFIPLVAFLAIATSFFGHYFGAKEGLLGVYKSITSKDLDPIKGNIYSAIFFILTLWGVAVLNPSILGIIESFGGPIIAAILFLMPVYAIYKVPAMARYKNRVFSNTFVVITGLISISSVIYGLI